MTPPEYPPSPAPSSGSKKKPMSGCLIAVLVVLAIGAMGVIAVGLGMYKFSQSEEGQKVFGVVGETFRAQAEAMDAPGTDEMKAAGCSEAMVMDLSRLLDMVEEMDEPLPADQGRVMIMVSCVTKDPDLDCERIKDVYLEAVPTPADAFLVQVTEKKTMVQAEPRCQQVYAPDGTHLDIEMDEAPDLTP